MQKNIKQFDWSNYWGVAIFLRIRYLATLQALYFECKSSLFFLNHLFSSMENKKKNKKLSTLYPLLNLNMWDPFFPDLC